MMKHPANTDAEAARRVEAAAESLRRGSGILLTDDEDRENEGDLIFPAESISIAQMAQLIRHCSGIVCLCISLRISLPYWLYTIVNKVWLSIVAAFMQGRLSFTLS